MVAPIINPPTKKAAAARKFKGRLGGGVPKTGGDWRGDHEGVAKKLAAGPAAEKGHPEQAAAGTGYPVFSEHCFVTSEVPRRFLALEIRRFEPQKPDLQFGSGPRPSNKQES